MCGSVQRIIGRSVRSPGDHYSGPASARSQKEKPARDAAGAAVTSRLKLRNSMVGEQRSCRAVPAAHRLLAVMAGLVPAIHGCTFVKDVDPRDKPGDDE